MRSHFWQYITNEEGQPIEGATISVYLTGTTTAVSVYTAESGGAVTTAVPQVTSDENGFFEFWIADSSDAYGYDMEQKYTIAWEKAGVITAGSIDNVEMAVQAMEVDETSTNTQKNKLVSNNQAKVWTAKSGMATVTAEIASWQSDVGGYYYDFEHDLDNGYPVVVAYNLDASPAVSVGVTVKYSSSNISRIIVGELHRYYITAIG